MEPIVCAFVDARDGPKGKAPQQPVGFVAREELQQPGSWRWLFSRYIEEVRKRRWEHLAAETVSTIVGEFTNRRGTINRREYRVHKVQVLNVAHVTAHEGTADPALHVRINITATAHRTYGCMLTWVSAGVLTDASD